MPTLAQQRAAIAAGISGSRGATGADERRATGSRIESERRGESVVEDINRLITPARQRRTLRTVPAVGGLPVTRGRGEYKPPAATVGGGIASPLTEKTKVVAGETVADGREYHPAQAVESSDGIFTLMFEPLKKLVMLDPSAAEVVFEFALPGDDEEDP